jgi:hypothetical protein
VHCPAGPGRQSDTALWSPSRGMWPLTDSLGGPRIIELPLAQRTVSDTEVEPRTLAEVLRESADLLSQSRAVEDQTIRDSAVDLAIRSLRAAAAAVDGRTAQARLRSTCRVLLGPWPLGQPGED